jgi:hypothetical protein
MDTNLALERPRSPEHLSIVREAHVSLELDIVIKTSLQDVGATQRMLFDSDTARLDVSLWNADTFIPMT